MDDEILSITGREIPHIGSPTREERAAWSPLLCMVFPLIRAIEREDWLAVAFWMIPMTGILTIALVGQPRVPRSTTQAMVMLSIFLLSTTPFLFPSHPRPLIVSLIGLSLAPIPWVTELVIAHRRRTRVP